MSTPPARSAGVSRLALLLAFVVTLLGVVGVVGLLPFSSVVVYSLFVLVGVVLLSPWAWPAA